MRKRSVEYHGAVKRTCRMNRFDGNHVAHESIRVDTFKHLHIWRLISYTCAMLSSRSPCLVHLSNNVEFMSQTSSHVEKFVWDNYQLAYVYRNLLCAVIVRIQFVQRNETRLSDSRKNYIPVGLMYNLDQWIIHPCLLMLLFFWFICVIFAKKNI